MLNLMEGVTKFGTGERLRGGAYHFSNPIAGKTGTAHVSDGKIKYSDGVYQATFVGYFPEEKPQYTF